MTCQYQQTLKLLAFLFVMPGTITFLHVRNLIREPEICFVGPSWQTPVSNLSSANLNALSDAVTANSNESSLGATDVYGIYRPSSSSSTRSFHARTVDKARADAVAVVYTLSQRNNEDSKYSPTSTVTSTSKRIWETIKNIILQRNGYPSLLPLNDDLVYHPLSAGSDTMISFNYDKKIWCFNNHKGEICINNTAGSEISDQGKEMKAEDGSQMHFFPPTGRSLSLQRKNGNQPLQFVAITCPASQYSIFTNPLQWWNADSYPSYRNNSLQKRAKNPNLEFLQLPATSLLILLNTSLAFIYWNNRTDPSEICTNYRKIIYEYELWRAFTGSTAHFEHFHIGFNMMGMYALGTELEPLFGTIPFMFLNICLIPLTTMVMMALVRMQIWYTGNERLKDTMTVGYSGVLFALMVMSSLERHSTCPVPFMPDLCFKTYHFDVSNIIPVFNHWVFKFNLGPWVQLLVAQVIMPRVSFVGHLAGILCGFLFHWNLLPREIFYMPHVLFPLMLLVHFSYVRRSITIRISSLQCLCKRGFSLISDSADDDTLLMVTHVNVSSRRKSDEKILRLLLLWVGRGMIAMNIIYVVIFNSMGSTFLSHLLTTLLMIVSSQQYRSDQGRDAHALWKATIISIVLILIADAISIPYWIQMETYIGAKWKVNGTPILVLVFLLRYTINFTALILASTVVTETGVGHSFGCVVRYSYDTFVALQRKWDSSKFNAFQGQGNVLG